MGYIINRPVNVLIVNQFNESSRFLVELLKESPLNYKVDITDNLKDGIKATQSGNHYDLLISGIGYNWGDSDAFIRHVKSKGYTCIVMSGYGKGIEEEVLRKGANAFIPIPFDINKVVKTIDSVVENLYAAKMIQSQYEEKLCATKTDQCQRYT